MANKRTPSITVAEFPAGRRDSDEDMLQALVTAGAFMALADAEPAGELNKPPIKPLACAR
jgi:hypothetical protein